MTKSNDPFVGSPSRQGIEQLYQARLVRITLGTLAIRLDPFGMLDPEILVNLLPELRVRVDLERRGHWLAERFGYGSGPFIQLGSSVHALRCEINEFHKCLSSWSCLLQIRPERGTIFRGALNGSLASEARGSK